MVERAATTWEEFVVAWCSHTFPKAPRHTTAAIAANSPHRRRAFGGAGIAVAVVLDPGGPDPFVEAVDGRSTVVVISWFLPRFTA
jgi:hypothetical protein